MSKENGGQAFPEVGISRGMTLRDYFAGQALCEYWDVELDDERVAEKCYGIADAMIKERGKQ